MTITQIPAIVLYCQNLNPLHMNQFSTYPRGKWIAITLLSICLFSTGIFIGTLLPNEKLVIEYRTEVLATITRIQIIESGAISHVKLNKQEAENHKPGDVVWVDLSTHTLNDTAQATMLCVIQ